MYCPYYHSASGDCYCQIQVYFEVGKYDWLDYAWENLKVSNMYRIYTVLYEIGICNFVVFTKQADHF